MPLVYDTQNPKAVALMERLAGRLDPASLPEDRMVVIGGDGYMLRTVTQHHAPDRLFVGLNCGHLGFLLNDIPEDLETLPGLLMDPDLKVRTFPRIAMEAEELSGKVVHSLAMNDVYLERTSAQGCHLRITINGTLVVEELVADGLIMCTALGSTAYSFSAGGVPCHPGMEIIGVTPVCPHVPRMSPLIFPLRSRVEVEVLRKDHRRVRVVSDGMEFPEIARVQVCDAGSPVRMGFFAHHDFTGTLVGKLLRF